MKKILSFLSLLLIFTYSSTYALTNDEEKNKLSKEVIVTTAQVKEDFGDTYVNMLDVYFANTRYYNDSNSLDKLEILLNKMIKKYNNKNILTNDEKKVLNLFNNMYLRAKLINKFYIK